MQEKIIMEKNTTIIRRLLHFEMFAILFFIILYTFSAALASREGIDSQKDNDSSHITNIDIDSLAYVVPAKVEKTPTIPEHGNIDNRKINLSYVIAGITSIVLFLSFWVNYRSHEKRTRPIVRFIIPNIQTGLIIKPLVKNETNTDAIGLPAIELSVRQKSKDNGGEDYSDKVEITRKKLDGAYSGNEIWYLPAKFAFSGNLNLNEPIIDLMEKYEGEEKNNILDYIANYEVSIRLSIYYKRWNYPFEWWRWPWFIACHLFYFAHFRKIYMSPVQKWVYSGGTWVSEPNLRKPERFIRVNLRRLNILRFS